nr:MAG TPA: hypothetical protein [Caudoviricetes sp.]
MKRYGIHWTAKGREFRDSAYDARYVSDVFGKGFYLVIYGYGNRQRRYEVECHRNGDAWYYVGTFWLFNKACKKAVEWATLKRLKGEI